MKINFVFVEIRLRISLILSSWFTTNLVILKLLALSSVNLNASRQRYQEGSFLGKECQVRTLGEGVLCSRQDCQWGLPLSRLASFWFNAFGLVFSSQGVEVLVLLFVLLNQHLHMILKVRHQIGFHLVWYLCLASSGYHESVRVGDILPEPHGDSERQCSN